MNESSAALPTPQRSRWQPLRGGLLNLYRYDHEEFWYEDGHLLLRGNNGTGKSRVLALQLPFLLDGEVSPHRLEPDGDPAKRVEWNLLMGRHSDRLGYTWLEFGRLGEDNEEEQGQPRYLTLGCGLLAVEGRGLVNRWFFTTDLRVGKDLFLEGSSGEALIRPRLAEVLGERGRVYTTASEYRDAVDRSLFHLGRARYEALVNLLIQLRQPQLSRKLDEGKLSQALSEALPPLSPTVLADVAESFRTLESDRQALDDLKTAGRGVDTFLGGYRRYAQIAARRRAEEVRRTHSAYDTTRRRLRDAEERSERAARRLAEITDELERLNNAGHEAQTEVRTLEARPEMRDKQALDAARRRAQDRSLECERAAQELERATVAHRAARQHHELTTATADENWTHLARSLEVTADEAQQGGLLRDHQRALERLGLPEVEDPAQINTVADRLEEVAGRRERGVRHVRELSAQVTSAKQALAAAREHHGERSAEVDDARERQQETARGLDRSVGSLLEAWAAWAAPLEELVPPSAGELDEALREWSRQPEGEGPLAEAVRGAERQATEALASLRAAVEQRRQVEVEELEGKTAEERELRQGVHRPPEVPHTRRSASREKRPGAPLWKVCDFKPTLKEEHRAGLEAALEAAGLLDAWITPEGQLLDAEDHDTVLLANSQTPPPTHGLNEVLQPQIDPEDPQAASLQPATLATVLANIGYGADQGEAWVHHDGRFRLGPLHGRWAKESPQHLGEGARTAERRRRLLRLAEEIADLEARIAALDADFDLLQKRRTTVQREATTAPEETTIRDAAAALTATTSAVYRARERLVEAEGRMTTRRQELEGAAEERDTAARDLGLADHLENLAELEEAVTAYRRSLAALWPTVRNHLAARTTAQAATTHFAEAEDGLSRCVQNQQKRHRDLREAEVERDTLERTLGAGVQEILARLSTARDRSQRLAEERHQTEEQRGDLRVEHAEAEKDIRAEEQTLERDQVERQAAFGGLSSCSEAGLLRVAMPDLDSTDSAQWSATRTVEVARRLAEVLSDVDAEDSAWGRQQRDVSQRLETLRSTLLPYGYDPELSMPDDLMVITVSFQGRQHPLDTFRSALGEEVEARDRVLAEKEREVLENHLLGEVAQHLHENLRAAEEWVQEMNSELEDRPMSTGMTLRFTWRPQNEEAVTGLAAARKLLMAEHGIWSPTERRAVGEFLHGRIKEERAENDLGTWQEHLATALDYRAWHTFGVERQQDGTWRRLTRRSHGTGSGGEKAIALTIPQFAAAAAHYRTAHPHAPRLILLDEVFVGVDADMRSKCMGLLQAFDLDFMMTSEREWGCYPTLKGLAIYQLATRQGIDAVSVSRWVWNGQERRHDKQMQPPSRSAPSALSEPTLPFGNTE
jgi:uncharacterized protein (TIGR02680 family)